MGDTYIHYISNECKIKITFIREKYGLARWDFELIKNGAIVANGVDVDTVAFDKRDAIIEILSEMLVDE